MRKVLYILGELSDLDVDWMIAQGRKETVPGGAAVIEEGRPVGALYVVLDGVLSVRLKARPDRELARLGVGEIAGEMSLIEARPPSATVRAVGNAVVLAIPRARLEAKLAQDQGFAARFYRALATFLSDRLRSTTVQLGYGGGVPSQDERDAADELDPNVLDSVHVAGARFDRMLKRLMAG